LNTIQVAACWEADLKELGTRRYNGKKGDSMGEKIVLHLLIFLIFVGSVSPVNAECGWVLWLKEDYRSIAQGSQSTNWNIVDAYPNYKQCQIARRGIYKQRKRSYLANKEENPIMQLEFDDNYEIIHTKIRVGDNIAGVGMDVYKCLPNTVDPRNHSK
jgi:hypothetical protein